MSKYVLGFLFSPGLDEVVLIKKNRPEWQAGKWNGVGGKVWTEEKVITAMAREFREEATAYVPENFWHLFAELRNRENGHEISCFSTTMPGNILDQVKTATDEEIKIWQTKDVLLSMGENEMSSFKVPWLVSMAQMTLRSIEAGDRTPELHPFKIEGWWKTTK